jgi:autotransporter-associated beta strand protein
VLGPANVAGALVINVAGAAAANSINFTNTAATTLSNTTSGSNQTLTLSSSGTAITTAATGLVTIGSATANQAVNVALGASQTWSVGNGGLRINNVISGSGFGITKSGTGTLTLAGANTFTGKVIVSAGTLSFNTIGNVSAVSSALGAPTTVANGTIDLAGSLTYTGAATSSNRVINLTSAGATNTITNSGTGMLTLSGGFTGGSTTIAFRGAQAITVSGIIPATHTGGVNRTDAGTLTLSNAANAFGGNLNVSQGSVSANSIADSGSASAIGAGSQITLGQSGFNNTGTFQFTGPSGGSSNRVINILSNTGNTNGGIIENTVSGQTLSLSGGVTIGGTGTTPSLQLTGAGNGEMSGIIAGTGLAITKAGAGTWTLSGANTYTGNTTVSAGTLVLSGSSATAQVNINGGTNTTLRITSATATGSGVINTANGATTPRIEFRIDGGGTIALPNALGGNSGVTTNIDVNNNGSGTNGVIQLNGSSALSAIGTATWNITGGNGYSLHIANLRSTAGSAGTHTFNPTSAALTIGNITGIQASGTNIWALGGTNTGNAVTGVISNGGTAAGAVTKSGTGTWALNGANTYTGATNATAGILRAGNAAAFGTTAGGVAITAGAVVDLNGQAIGAEAFTVNGTGISSGGALINSSATAASLSGTVTMASASSFGGDGAGAMTLSGVVSGAFALTKVGTGTMVLSGVNTYSGATNTTSGILRAGNAAAFGTTAGGVSISDGAVVDLNGQAIGAEAFTVNGTGISSGGALVNNSGTAASLSGAVTMGTASSIGGSGSLTLSGALSGAFALTKVGTGTTVLTGNNTYSGGTSIANGSLQLASNTAAGSGAISLLSGGNTTPTRIFIAGGVTAANNISFGVVFGAGGQGVLQQTGTGQGRLNGTINISGGPSAGGHFVGGNSLANALVLGGAISTTVPEISQRDGHVVYAGGGAGGSLNSLIVTSNAHVGATDGIHNNANVQLGGSAAATLHMNGFNQTLPGIRLGNAAQNFVGTVNLGSQTLTLQNSLATLTPTTGNASHTVNATAGAGTLSSGTTNTDINVNDSLAVNDLVFNNVTLAGSGGFTKIGAGSLVMNNVVSSAPLTNTAGNLVLNNVVATGPFTQGTGRITIAPNASGLFTADALNFTGDGIITMELGGLNDLIAAGPVTASGVTTFSIQQVGGLLANGTYPLLTFTGTPPDAAAFVAAVEGRATSSIVVSGTTVSLQVTDNDSITWTGEISSAWSTGSTSNWKTTAGQQTTDYFSGDEVFFTDETEFPDVVLAGSLTPSKVTFTNATDAYILSGSGSITGLTSLIKNNAGTATLAGTAAHTYTGATTINGGTLAVDQASSGLTATSGISIASGATLSLISANLDFAINRVISGAGIVALNPNRTGLASSRSVSMTGASPAFSGTLLLEPSGDLLANGSFRLSQVGQAALGTANVVVKERAQLWASGTIANNLTITGYGMQESAATALQAQTVTGAGNSLLDVPVGTYTDGVLPVTGGLGAIRLDPNAVLTGTITLAGDAKISAYNTSATIAGSMAITNPTDDLVIGGMNSATNLFLTGDNQGVNGLERIWINGGGSTGNNALYVGNNTATGTLGKGDVILYTDGASSTLRFQRSDGYTLATGQDVIAAHDGTSSNLVKATVTINTPGSGVNIGANVIDLSDGAFGGFINIGVTNANSKLTIPHGATVEAGRMYLGDASGFSGLVDQPGGDVTLIQQLRVGHFGNETSVYHLSGGSITLTGDAPSLSPSTSGAGSANTTGDNNINASATATSILGGGVYLGIDGTGIMNHSGGTLSTNWIVLDNRADSGSGLNMVDGVDRYNLSGTGLLKLKSTWGLIQRNVSTAVSLGGGTIQVDNTGTGPNTGADIVVPLDATLDTVAASITTLDTNGAGNGISLLRDVTGTGTLALTGGGSIRLSTGTVQNVAGTLTSTGAAPSLVKLGSGSTTIANSLAGFTGDIAVNAGRLNLPVTNVASDITVADGATLFHESSVATLTLGQTTGANLLFDPNSPAVITTTDLVVNGTNVLDVTAASTTTGKATVIQYTNKTGDGTFTVADSSNYRTAPTVVEEESQIKVDFAVGKTLTWTGSASGVWDINGTQNWADSVPAAEKFFTSDAVVFTDGGANSSLTIAGLVAPSSIVANAAATDYTITSTAGNQITGSTGLTKSGASTLTLTGPNLYTGVTAVNGGSLVINSAASLGSGSAGNGITLSGGGTLRYNTAAALDLGVARGISAGTGGGAVIYGGTTAATITIPGALSGSNTLALQSAAAGGATFALTGNNSAFTGELVIDSLSTGLTTVSISSQSAVPQGGAITIDHPALGAAAGNVTVLSLANVTIPSAVTMNMTAGLNGTLGMRSQITFAGNVNIDGPIRFSSNNSAVQVTGGTGSTLTINGNITAASEGAFSGGTFFPRGNGQKTINGTVNLPGATFAHTENGNLTINSTGNVWAQTTIAQGSMTMGVANALATTANLTMGQNDTVATALNMAGFSQEVGALASNPVSGTNANSKTISSTTAATLTVNQSTNSGFGGIISGPISLVKSGSGTLALNNANTATGSVTISAGGLALGNGGTTGSISTTSAIVNDGTLIINRSNAVTQGTDFTASAITGNGGIAQTGAGTTTLITDNTCSGSNAVSAGTLILGTGGTTGSLGAGPIAVDGTLVFNRSNSYLLAATNLVTGSGAVVLAGAGPVVAAVNNQFATTGALIFGDVAGSSTLNELDLTNSSSTFGSINVRTNSSSFNSLKIGDGKTLLLTNGLTMGINGSLATLTRLAVTGEGSMGITGGNVQVGVAQTTADSSNNSNASLDLSGLTGALGFAANVTNFNVGQGATSGGVVTLTNTTNAITATTMNIGNSATRNGTGPNRMILGTGINAINADTINIGISKTSGTLNFASQADASPGIISIGNAAGDGGANLTLGSNNGTATGTSFTGLIDLRGHASAVALNDFLIGIGSNTAAGSTTGELRFNSGTLSMTNVTQASKSGAGGTGTAFGTITIGGGSVVVNTGGSYTMATNSAATGAATANLNLNGGTFTSNVDILKGVGTNTTANITLNGGTLDMTGKNIGGVELINNFALTNGTLQNLGEFNGGAALIKNTVGTVTLAGVNTHTGNTAVNAGTLVITGSIASTASAASSGTLAGNGTINGAATIATSGVLSPGNNSVATLNFGSTLTLDAGSEYAVTITGNGVNDKVNVTGALTASGDITVSLDGYTPMANDTFDLADAASIAGTPNLILPTLSAGLSWDTSTFATNGQIKVISADPFLTWASGFGLSGGDAAKSADPDGDGVNNLLEFATNSNPTNGGSGARVYGKIHMIAGTPVLTYTVATRADATFAANGSKQESTKDLIKYTIEGSDDLSTWNTVVVTEVLGGDATAVRAAIVPALPTLDTGWEWHTFRTDGDTSSDASDYIRLNVTEVP